MPNIYTIVVDSISIFIGVLGLVLPYLTKSSSDSLSPKTRNGPVLIPGNIVQHNYKIKQRIINSLLLIGFLILIFGILYYYWDKIPVVENSSSEIINILNSYMFFILHKMTTILSYSIPILSFFVLLKTCLKKAVVYRRSTIVSTLLILFFSIFSISTIKNLDMSTFFIVEIEPPLLSLYSFAQTLRGGISICQIFLYLVCLSFLIEQLLLNTLPTALLDQKIRQISFRFALPLLFLSMILYWLYVRT